jgi:REP element-mobilizing transposase RayT
MYHIVCPAKFRRVIFDDEVDQILRETCLEISKRYEIEFLEIGTDKDHVHFLIQSVPTYSPTKIVKTIKSITAIEIRRRSKKVRDIMWKGNCWTEGYFISTVGQRGNEETIAHYVKNQGKTKEYKILHRQKAKQVGQIGLWVF